MTNAFVSIELSDLSKVSGGADQGQQPVQGETTNFNIGAQVPTKIGNVNLGIQGANTKSEYAKCVSSVAGMSGVTPADIRATCGLPGGGQ